MERKKEKGLSLYWGHLKVAAIRAARRALAAKVKIRRRVGQK
jgi:hypothetical protein